jgi:2,4-dienoyl-CoA reductase-like NADH-dependent reductase (Old Yellow Enzyme family)
MPVLRIAKPMSEPSIDLLFRPLPFGRAALRNRLVMGPMTRRQSPGGVPGANVVDYYRRRAEGGVGLVVSEGTYIDHPGASGYENVPNFFGAEALAGWRRVVAGVHAAGARMIPQLWHVGGVRQRGMPPDPAVPGFGPSAVVADGVEMVEGMTAADLREVADSYARGARAAEDLGFDGVAIHAAHGYLLDQFFWIRTNRRGDAYGGPLANRVRFAAEVVAAMRGAVSRDFPIVFRFSQWKMDDYDARIADTPDELATILQPLAEAGVDFFDVSTRRFWLPGLPGYSGSLAAWTRKLSGKPVIAVGSVGLDQPHQSKVFRTRDNVAANVVSIAPVLEGMARGDFDLVAVARAILADPEWAEKIRRGAYAEIRAYTHHSAEIYH